MSTVFFVVAAVAYLFVAFIGVAYLLSKLKEAKNNER